MIEKQGKKCENASDFILLLFYIRDLGSTKIHRITELDKTTFHYRIYYKILDKYNTNTTY